MNALVFTKESVAKAVTEDIVRSINKEAQGHVSEPAPVSEPAFQRDYLRVLTALERLECTVTFKMPETARFQELVHEILMLPTCHALETLADVALGDRPGYDKRERVCASQIHAAI